MNFEGVNMRGRARNDNMPNGWISLTRSCKRCGAYIPRYGRVCPKCGKSFCYREAIPQFNPKALIAQ